MSIPVWFIDQSQAGNTTHTIIGWLWQFGDGGRANTKIAQHNFDEAGQYEVSLTVTNNCGNSSTLTKTIDITGDNMTTYTQEIVIVDSNKITIKVPIIEAVVPIQFIDEGLGTPLVGNVELINADGVVLQTMVTDSDGTVLFGDVVHGAYTVRITY